LKENFDFSFQDFKKSPHHCRSKKSRSIAPGSMQRASSVFGL